jgi:hypothetical protein
MPTYVHLTNEELCRSAMKGLPFLLKEYSKYSAEDDYDPRAITQIQPYVDEYFRREEIEWKWQSPPRYKLLTVVNK